MHIFGERKIKLRDIGADLPCQCGECNPVMIFQCEECFQHVPWCYGADNRYFELCDDCAVKYLRADEAGDWE